ncbi:XRE family transcriptional regulator [Pseudomonas alliivorans]|nr:XRE family transcriptional regulator [Pseudomonas alliivorans]
MKLQLKVTTTLDTLQGKIAMMLTTSGCILRRMKTTGSRIAASREQKGMNQSELARRLNVTPQSVQAWESDRNVPRPQRLKAIADVLQVSLSYLVGDADTDPSRDGASNVEPFESPDRLYRYPVLSWVSAGAWAEATEIPPDSLNDGYELTDYKSKGPAFWLKIKGDSMTSAFGISVAEGSLVLIDTGVEPRPGKLVVAKISGSQEATFKKLVEDGGQQYLKPLNPSYPTQLCGEDCRIVGVAVRSLMML